MLVHRAYRSLVVLLAASFVLTPQSVSAHLHVVAPLITSITKAGITLTLSVPRRIYPRNAVISVTVTVAIAPPLSTKPVAVSFGSSCDNDVPAVARVLNAHHQVLDPLRVLPSSPPHVSCPGPGPYTVTPADPSRTTQYVVLRGDRIAAQTGQFYDLTAPHDPAQQPIQIQTPELRLTLVNAPAPGVIVKHNPMRAVLHDASAQGRMIAVQWAWCPGHVPDVVGSDVEWVLQPPGHALHPPCSNPSEWHALVGYLNRPVVLINQT